jgi:plasmid maintenance system antidote protein VapI
MYITEEERKLDKALWLRSVIYRQGLTNRKLAQLLGITPQALGVFINGKVGWPQKRAEQVSKILGIPIDKLLG